MPHFGREGNLSGHLPGAGQAIAPVYALVEVLNEAITRNMRGKYAAAQHGLCGTFARHRPVRHAGSQLSALWGAT